MRYKVSQKHLSSGSAAEKDRERIYEAFSLAEMLCVLLIMSFIVIGLPAIHFKKTELKTKRSLHGRYECYYEGNQLMEYTVNEDGTTTGSKPVAECKFTPPSNAIFFLVHAVGGGGGASSSTVSANCTPNTVAKSYERNQANDFPQWLKDVQGAGQLPTLNDGEKYETEVIGQTCDISYSNGGKAGETVSYFFPRLSNKVQISMKPCKGGSLNGDGAVTEVKIGDVKFEAAGGSKGSGGANINLWYDSANSVCEVKDNASREPEASDFGSSIEMDYGTKMISKMASSCAGGGGAGGYGELTGTPTTVYKVNGVDVTRYVKKTECQAKLECVTKNDSTSAQAGGNGAVVILW